MSDDLIPQSMQVAKDVTEEEYQKALLQSRLTLILTFSVPIGAFLYWLLVDASFFHSDETPPFRLAIVWGVLANRFFYYTLKEGKKMSTLRMQKYKELRRLRKAMSRNNTLG